MANKLLLQAVPYQPKAGPPKNGHRGPLNGYYNKSATSRDRIAFKTKYRNCRHNFGRTRPV